MDPQCSVFIMHQLSIIRQSERVKGDWWTSSPISLGYTHHRHPPTLCRWTFQINNIGHVAQSEEDKMSEIRGGLAADE